MPHDTIYSEFSDVYSDLNAPLINTIQRRNIGAIA